MKQHYIIKEIKEILKDDYIAIKTDTWGDSLHYIHIGAHHCSFYQAMELSRVTGDCNLLFSTDGKDHLDIIANLKHIVQ